mmetsp:Transcript_61753/g.74297  ORF Transcript_61753/g.74297 Transcript_61753/m.74297 type:complete len:118 (-) Transcript_61753:413-766(-)
MEPVPPPHGIGIVGDCVDESHHHQFPRLYRQGLSGGLNANNVKFLKKHVLKLDETTNGDSNYQNIGGNGHGMRGLGGSKVHGLLTKRRMDHQQIKWDHKVHQWYDIKGNENVEGDEQ